MTDDFRAPSTISLVFNKLRWVLCSPTVALASCGGGGGDSPAPEVYKPVGYNIPYPNKNTLEFFQSVKDSYQLQYVPKQTINTGQYPIDSIYVGVTKEYYCQYVANQDSNNLSIFKGKFPDNEVQTGTNSVVGLPPVNTGKNPSGVGLDFGQSHRFVYVSNFGETP
jgi:hypothetical protein